MRRLALHLLLAAAAFAAYHLALQAWLRATGGRLGAISARLVAPLHAYWDPVAPGPWALPALLVLAAFVAAAPRLLDADGPRPPAFLAAAVGLFLAIGLSVSLIDGIVELRDGRRLPGFLVPYTKARLEYVGDVPHVERMGVRRFLEKFARPRLFDQLALHTRTHPPGGVLFHWLAARAFGPGVWTATLASIAFTALVVVLAYALGRLLHGEAVARLAVGLLLVAPSFVLYSFTSMDGVFAVFPLLSLWLLARARRDPPRSAAWGLALGAALAAGSFMTYAVPAFLAVFVAAWLAVSRREREAWAAGLRALSVAAAVVAGFYGGLALWAGYDPLAAVRMSIAHDAHLMGGTGHESLPRFLSLGFANLFAFLMGAGVVLSTLLVRETAGAGEGTARGAPRDPFTPAVAASLVVLSFSTLFTLEVERVWLFLVPLAAISAARHLVERAPSLVAAGLPWLLGVSAGQVALMEALLRTDW